jgi:hypothetical protein
MVNKFSAALTTACNKSFKVGRTYVKTNKHKTVPWWTEDLTIARKRVNAFRRKYQRTKSITIYVTNGKPNTTQKRLNTKQK